MFGVLQNIGVSGEIYGRGFGRRRIGINLRERKKKRYKCVPTEMEEETFSISSNVSYMNH